MASPYEYPGIGVLRNKPGLRDRESLRLFEYEAVAQRTAALLQKPVKGSFDLGHLQAIHKTLFQDVYDWAGELRTVDIAKGHTQFARPAFLETEGKRLSLLLARERHLRDLAHADFVARFTEHYAEWNALHPFREGNGRALRVFFGDIARAAGYTLDNTRIDNGKGQWDHACEQSFLGDSGPLAKIFKRAIAIR